MKSFLLFLIAVFSFSTINAQIKRNPHFISINAGASIPVGEYGNLDTALVSSANLGTYIGLEGAVYVTKFLGFGANIGAYMNPVDEDDLIERYTEQGISSQNITINSDDWLNGYAMVGMYLTIPIKKIRLDFKFLGGAVNSEKPLVEIAIDNKLEKSVIVNKSTDAVAFGINYGAHLRIPIASKFYLRLNAETFTSLPEFKSQTETVKSNINSLTKQTIEQTISVLNLGVGLTFSF